MPVFKKFLSIIFTPTLVGKLSTVYGIFSFVRDEWLPMDVAEKLRLGGIFSMIEWYWWVIVGLILWGVGVAWEAAKINAGKEGKTQKTDSIIATELGGGNTFALRDNYGTITQGHQQARQATPQEEKETDSDVQRFSLYLDENLKELSKNPLLHFTGNGLSFLSRIKKAPPFLGKDYGDPVLYPDVELKLSEHFRAADFKEANVKSIKGGSRYTVTDEDTTWKTISKKNYGSVKFANQIKTFYPTFPEPKTGLVIELPFIDTSGKLGKLSSQYINNQYTRASFDWIKSTFTEIADSQMISVDEVAPLLFAVYDASQKTLHEQDAEYINIAWNGVKFDIWSPRLRDDPIIGIKVTNNKGDIKDFSSKIVEAYYWQDGKHHPYLHRDESFPVTNKLKRDNSNAAYDKLDLSLHDVVYIVLDDEEIKGSDTPRLKHFFGARGERGFVEIDLLGLYNGSSIYGKLYVKISYENNKLALKEITNEKPIK